MDNLSEYYELSQTLLAPKRNPEVEITAHLHERCNLTCSFCFCDVKEDLNKAYIHQGKIDKIKHVITQSQHLGQALVIHYMGGEIFDPDIFNHTSIDLFVDMVVQVDQHAKACGFQHINHNFVSNLIVDIDCVLNYLDTLKALGYTVSLGTSYDAKGRFNQANKKQWLSHLNTIKERGYPLDISMLFTKPVIKLLLNDQDDTFKYLYQQGYKLYIDYYTPTTGYGGNQQLLQTNMPSDVDLLKAFVYLMDHYPKVEPVASFIHKQGYISCRRSELTTPDADHCKCGNLHLNDPIVHFYKSKIQPNDNREIETRFILERDCISCRHFHYCQMGCFMQHDFSKRTQLVDCLFKLAYDYAENRQSIDFDQLETKFG